MLNKLRASPSEAPSPNQQAPAGFRRFGKKPYAALAAAATIVIIVAAFFVPQGSAIIPLNVDYVVGEKMVYDTTMTMTLESYNMGSLSFPAPNSTNLNNQQTIEVIDFDGENYLLNNTMTANLLGKPFSFTITERINKTGYSTYLLNIGNTQTEIPKTGSVSSNTYLAQLLSKPEAKVGDSITVPYPTLSSSIQVSGDLTVKFNGIEDLTVQAGTYRVFRIDLTSNNLQITYKNPTNSSLILPSDLVMKIDISGQIYMEYGTMRQIKSTLEQSSTYQSTTLNMTSHMTTEMTLTQHIKP